MIGRFLRCGLLMAAIVIGSLCAAAQAMALEVRSVRFGAHPGDQVRMVIELDRAVDFRTFMLDQPVRMVIDLPHFTWKAGTIARLQTSGISDIRQGALEPGLSRIAIDLDHPVLIRAAFMLPRDGGLPDRLVIDYARANPTDFAAGRGRIFGTLGGKPANTAAATGTAIPTPAPTPARTSPTPTPAPTSGHKPIIVIDPGHGGADPGAVGANGLLEKNITLAMARDLKRHLEATGRYRVFLTRERDVFIRLQQRVAIARQRNADLFISLHADSINRAGVRGASVYTLSDTASDAETEKLAARENRADMISGLDLRHEDEDVANILVNLTMRDTMNQSRFFANTTVETLRRDGVRLLENPHRFAGFAVLKAADIPSVLIELGYMSNAQDSALLSRQDYRDRLARALLIGVDDYFETLRRNNAQ